jgi:hypothetical protein
MSVSGSIYYLRFLVGQTLPDATALRKVLALWGGGTCLLLCHVDLTSDTEK